MEKNEFKKFRIRNRTCYYFDNMIKIEDFDSIIFYWMKNHMKLF